MSDINELRRLAQMATPGPWMIDCVGVGFEVAAGESVIAQSQQIQGDMRHKTRKANAAFIAAANPAAISDLLDRLEAAESARRDDYQNWMTALDRNAELLAKLEAAEKNLSCCQAEREEAAALFLSIKTRLTEERNALRAELTQLHKEADKFGDGIDWIQRALQAEAQIEAMEKQEPDVWMQSTHLSSFKNRLCGSQSSYVHCSDHQLHPDFKPLYTLSGAQQCKNCNGMGDRFDTSGEKIPCDLCESNLEEIRVLVAEAAHDIISGGDFWLSTSLAAKKIYALPGAQPTPSVPEGWQLVPTAESRHPGIYKMLGALHAADNTPGMSEWESYRAMLSEAPEAKP